MSEQAPEPQPDETPDAPAAPAPDEPAAPDAGDDEDADTQPTAPDEGEPDPAAAEPSAPGAVNERELEKMFKRVETANASYARKIGEILGDEAAVLEVCPRCSDPFIGLIWPPAMKRVDDERRNAVLASVGAEPEEVTMHDPYSRRCDTCDGAGRVLTGSRVNREKTIKCFECKGSGWLAVGDERRADAARGATDATHAAQAPAANGSRDEYEPAPDTDLWGRPANHPDYGMHPQYARAR